MLLMVAYKRSRVHSSFDHECDRRSVLNCRALVLSRCFDSCRMHRLLGGDFDTSNFDDSIGFHFYTLYFSSLPSLSLPAAPLPPTPNIPPKPCIIEPTVKDSYVLLVDDNPTNCKLLGRMLEHFQLDYKIANNGQEAVDIIQQSKNVNPDKEDAPYCSLIFMDWQMPVMDGREATETLRQRYKLDIPIVALTANVSQKHRDDAMEAGADEFATKPILREDLFKKCQYYLCDRNQYSGLPKTL